jgi:CRISPR/Cas system-associated endoribonuclease Cas2
MSYVIVYDIKELDNATRLKVSRRLRKFRALKLQQSVWEFERLADLRELVCLIKEAGGKAFVMKKQVVYE